MSRDESANESLHSDPRVKRGHEGDIFILQDDGVFMVDDCQARQLIEDLEEVVE